ncbi:MAG: cyclic nucleotide-binding domain-containing protein [Bacteroidota bacterium]
MVNLLELLPEYVLHWLVQKGKDRRLQAKEVLLKEGEHNDSLFLVLDGLFGTYVTSATESRLEHHGAGSILGEMSFFTDGVSSELVVAEEESQVLEIQKSSLKEKLDYDAGYASDFYKALLYTVSQKLRHTSLKLYAMETEARTDATKDPAVKKAQAEIDRFKETIVKLDKSALKFGGLSEEQYQEFSAQAEELMYVCHSLLGDNSPLNEYVREQIGARLQHEMLPYVLTTETADRFYSKPRGYAGDYLAIHRIYQNVPGGTGRLGPLVDRMFLDTPPARALRNRRSLLASEILATVETRPNDVTRILCLASGPATEVFDAFSSLDDPHRLKATLMDIDLQALAFVDEVRSKEKLTNQIALTNENLIALFLGRVTTTLKPQDLIYSMGLIDYLNDKLVGKLLQYAYDSLAPGGRVLLGNFHPKNPAKEFMDFVLEWRLIHRTKDDMNRLFLSSPFRRPCTKIFFEEEGVDLFAECRKEEQA